MSEGGEEMVRRLVLACVVGAAMVAGSSGPARAITGLLPDLQTLPPANLYLEAAVLADGRTHHLLRFDNTVWNAGLGRLELEGRKRSKIYQRFYDRASGGTMVDRVYIGNDSIFHRGHNHYHIEHFASYLLVGTGKQGTKTSFCIIDYVNHTGQHPGQYSWCGRELQGLSVGWGDTYHGHLDEQWVGLGLSPLADGQYTLQSTANPRGRLIEAAYGNNTAQTCFSVAGGRVTSEWAC